METTGRIPTETDLLKLAIALLADQEGVKITYTIERKEHEEVQNQKRQHC